MKRNSALVAGGFAACLLCGTAFGPAAASFAAQASTAAAPMANDAAGSGATGGAAAGSAAMTPANPPHVTRTERRDFTKLSTDGQAAFGDVTLARLAIFDGRVGQAATLVDNAQTAFDRAAMDNTAFMKAEGDMKSSKNAMAEQRAAENGTPSADKSTPIAWIPVDQQFVLSETLSPTARNTAALASANAHLKAGEMAQAEHVLRVSSVAAVDTIALAPLDASSDDIHRAAQLMSAHDYYAASQALRMAVDGVRFDTLDVVAPVHKGRVMTRDAMASVQASGPNDGK